MELKVGPIKRANRIGVKISEYEKEKGAGDFPFSQFVTDVLRASYVRVSCVSLGVWVSLGDPPLPGTFARRPRTWCARTTGCARPSTLRSCG